MAEKIARAGLYDISMDAYHGQPCVGPSVSSSGLRTLFLKSPAHYWVESSLNPDRIEEKEKDAFTLGRAAHHLLLGEDDFSTLFVVRPDTINDEPWHSNKTICRDWIKRQKAAGRTVLLASQLEQIRGMAKSLADHPLVIVGVLNGQIEKSLIWQDTATGIWLKARPDAIPNDSGDFADLKTAANVGFDLDRDISRYRYDMQAALTKWGARAVLGLEMESFSFVFVEKERPHCVDVISLSKEDIEQAEKDLRAALDTMAWCLEHNNWFGSAGTQLDARWVHISEWSRKEAEFKRDFLAREIQKAKIVPSPEDYLAAG